MHEGLVKIALDFDGTYTLHPEFWDLFLHNCKAHGIKVLIVTLRHATHDRLAVEAHLERLGAGIVYCGGRPKAGVLKERKIEVDVWVEDDPRCVHEGSRFNDEQLANWRKNDAHRKRH